MTLLHETSQGIHEGSLMIDVEDPVLYIYVEWPDDQWIAQVPLSRTQAFNNMAARLQPVGKVGSPWGVVLISGLCLGGVIGILWGILRSLLQNESSKSAASSE